MGLSKEQAAAKAAEAAKNVEQKHDDTKVVSETTTTEKVEVQTEAPDEGQDKQD